MKIIRQNEKCKLFVQTIIFLIIPAILFTGCGNIFGNGTIFKTIETESVQKNDPDELFDPEVNATENSIENENAFVQPEQIAISCGTPTLSIEAISREHYCGREVLNIQYDKISVSGDGFEAVAQTISEWNKQDVEQIENLKNYAGYTHELSSVVDCNRIDNSVISFKQKWSEQDGFIYYKGINFDVASGKKLNLADILIDEEGFNKKATKIAVEELLKISDADKLPSGYADDVAYDFTNGIVDSDNKWYLNAYGIVYSYTNSEDTVWHGYIPNHHEDIPESDENLSDMNDRSTDIDSHLPGNITVTIPYADVAEYMKSAYCGIQDVGVAQFFVNETVYVNLSNNRRLEKPFHKESAGSDFTTLDTVLITMNTIGTGEDIKNRITITINNKKEAFETEAWMQSAYLLRQEKGSTYLLFDTAFADHDYTTYLYDITNGDIIKNEELEYTWIIRPVNANSLILLDIINAFGTYFGHATYIIDESTGKLVYPELHYTSAENSNIMLILVKELPVIIYGKRTTLPPGTSLQITAVSDSGTAYFYEPNNGIDGEFYFTIDASGTICIDGLEESSYFEFLPYSG